MIELTRDIEEEKRSKETRHFQHCERIGEKSSEGKQEIKVLYLMGQSVGNAL